LFFFAPPPLSGPEFFSPPVPLTAIRSYTFLLSPWMGCGRQGDVTGGLRSVSGGRRPWITIAPGRSNNRSPYSPISFRFTISSPKSSRKFFCTDCSAKRARSRNNTWARNSRAANRPTATTELKGFIGL